LKLKRVSSINEIPIEKWRSIEDANFPFTDYEFLHSLEMAGCVGESTGWMPVYCTAWNDDENILQGCLILFEKTNSYGEYIFDWQWADAYLQNGIDYYPKVVSAIPYTPATGTKLLINRILEDREPTLQALVEYSQSFAKKISASSNHHLFIPDNEIELYRNNGFFIRLSFQFHWRNRKYGSFDDFTETLKGKKRKSITKERREADQSGITFRRLSGDSLREEHAKTIFMFYRNTIEKMQAIPYLNEKFFESVIHLMKDRMLWCVAEKEGKIVAGAINFFKGEKIFGRYWGCSEDIKHLHFELCYYQAIEFAIERGIHLFEAGAQGEHKLGRGFLPSFTYSAHEIAHPAFRRAIGEFIADEARQLRTNLADESRFSPFKLPPQ